jgi:cytidine deaminase
VATTDVPPPDAEALLRQARALQPNAYAPYSGFRVGAVVVTADGQVFEGVNVENASYRLTTCAEQTALVTMVTAGVRSPVVAVAVVGDGPEPCTPCGACRQTVAEFGPDATVHAAGSEPDGPVLTTQIAELLPYGFGAERLAAGQRPAADDGAVPGADDAVGRTDRGGA